MYATIGNELSPQPQRTEKHDCQPLDNSERKGVHPRESKDVGPGKSTPRHLGCRIKFTTTRPLRPFYQLLDPGGGKSEKKGRGGIGEGGELVNPTHYLEIRSPPFSTDNKISKRAVPNEELHMQQAMNW